MTHTPGPWKEHEGFIIGRFNSDNEIHDICDPRCAPPDADIICEMNANAHLIAAAPELLEALMFCLSFLTANNDGEDDVVERIKTAKSAILKATGEQP